MKKLLMATTLFLLVLISACGGSTNGAYEDNGFANTPPPSPGSFPPMVFVDDVLFITTGSLLNPTLDESWVFIGEVESNISGEPREHLQVNFNALYVGGEMTDIVGVGRVYRSPNAEFPVWSPDVATSPPQGTTTVSGDGVIIDVNGQHFHFASVDTRQHMDDVLFGRLPVATPTPTPTAAVALRIQPALENAVRMGVDFAWEDGSHISVTLFNGSDYELMTGSHFTIESFNGNDWQRVSWRGTFTGLFTDEGYSIFPNAPFSFVKNLNLVEPLGEGLYRVRKQVFRVVDIPIRDGNLHDIVAEFRVEPHSLNIVPVHGICLECGDHPAGTHFVRDFRTEWANYIAPLSIRDIYFDGMVEYYLVPLDDFLQDMNTVHQVFFDQWVENQWEYATIWPLSPNILIQTDETVYDFAFIHIELDEDSEGAPAYVVQSRIFELDTLRPGDAVVMSVRFVHYLIPRGAIMFTDSAGNRHRRLIADASVRGGCWPHWWLALHGDNDWAVWVD